MTVPASAPAQAAPSKPAAPAPLFDDPFAPVADPLAPLMAPVAPKPAKPAEPMSMQPGAYPASLASSGYTLPPPPPASSGSSGLLIAAGGGGVLLLLMLGAFIVWRVTKSPAAPPSDMIAQNSPYNGANNSTGMMSQNPATSTPGVQPPAFRPPGFPNNPAMPGTTTPGSSMPGPGFSGPGYPGAPNPSFPPIGMPGPSTPSSPGSSGSSSGSTSGSPEATPSTPPTSPAVGPSFGGDQPPVVTTPPANPTAETPATPTPEAPQSGADEELPWRGSADPLPQPVEYKKGKIQIELPSSVDVILPVGTSHFVLAKASEALKEIRQVFDLRTGKPIGKPILMRLEMIESTEVLSADGRYVAAVQDQGEGKCRVGVWSFATGDVVREIMLPGEAISGPLRFGATHRLITLHRTKDRVQVLSHIDVQTGQTLLEIPFPDSNYEQRVVPESLTVSPGGRFAVLLIGQMLGVVDLSIGKPAGTIALSAKPSSCEGMAFSPDGTRLAAMLKNSSVHQLVCFDFITGKTILDYEYRNGLDYYSYKGPPLDWVPDGSGLVYKGHLLLEPTSGGEVWEFAKTDQTPRRMIRPGEMLVVLRDRNIKKMVNADLPEKDIANAIAAVRDGGQAVDSLLPPISTPDLFSARQMTLPNGFQQWSGPADSGDRPAAGLDRELLIATPGEGLNAVAFASPSSKKVIVQKEVTPRAVGGRRPTPKGVIERYDIATGQKGNSLDIPTQYQLCDVSPSGNFAVLAFAFQREKYDRIDVLQISPKKHIAGWRPYANEKKKTDAELQGQPRRYTFGRAGDPSVLAWIKMVDEEHLLTVNTQGKLICWKLPECKAVYIFEDFGEPLAVSAGGKFLAGVHHGEFRMFETLTGNCVGDLETPALGLYGLRGAFRADGKELAAIIDAGTDRMLVRWNLETGKREHEFPIPPSAMALEFRFFGNTYYTQRPALEYRGDDHLLLDDRHLIDLSRRTLAWRYVVDRGCFAACSPNGSNWYIAPKGQPGNMVGYFLTSQPSPSELVEKRIEPLQIERQLVVYPGMEVRMQIDLNSTFTQQLQPKVEQSLAAGLASRGLKINPNAELLFSFITAQRSTGGYIGVSDRSSPFGGNPFFRQAPPSEVFQQQEMVYRMAFSDRSGKVLWHIDRSTRMRDFGSISGDNAQAQLQDEMFRQFEAMLAGGGDAMQSVPRYVFRDLNTILAGQSKLSLGTEILEPIPPIVLPPGAQAPAEPGISPGS